MKKFIKTIVVVCIAMLLAACGQSGSNNQAATQPAEQQSNELLANQLKVDEDVIVEEEVSDASLDNAALVGESGQSTGAIVVIAEEARQIVIDHEAIDEINMGAMTMGFSVLSDIDLSEYAVDDRVSFKVKKGLDGDYQITAMCNTGVGGKECLNDVAVAAAKPKPDMKKMFGPDYKKGDIGHSKGVVQSIDIGSNQMIIDHGTVHGTSVVAAVTNFEAMEATDISKISEGVRVEFLVKKGTDGVYRLLSICDLGEDGTKCL